ncbi:MAG: hypothetical protein JF616_22810 [Fibrobacteres bacterium]|nr:hypothetical protein [Fibrobacterota bacterium]
MKSVFWRVRGVACVLAMVSLCPAGKQRIILRLKDPLRAESIQIHAPGLSNGHGETRDLDAKVELGTAARSDAPAIQDAGLKLGMSVHNYGKSGVQVTLTLPTAGYVELSVMDFYGKRVATLVDGNLPAGIYPLRPVTLNNSDANGIKFLTLRINGKVALKKVITKVR